MKKPRPAHLRAVPAPLSLPFFDEPQVEPVVAAVPEPDVEIARVMDIAPVAEGAGGLASEDRERLEELLDELTGLKARLQASRARLR